MEGREGRRLLRYALYHLLAAGLLGWISFLLFQSYLSDSDRAVGTLISAVVFAVLGLIFGVRMTGYIQDWKDGEVLEFRGIISRRSFLSILTTVHFQFEMLVLGEQQAESYDVGIRDFFRYRSGDSVVWRIAPRMKSVVTIYSIPPDQQLRKS